jgi:hypothetical protein
LGGALPENTIPSRVARWIKTNIAARQVKWWTGGLFSHPTAPISGQILVEPNTGRTGLGVEQARGHLEIPLAEKANQTHLLRLVFLFARVF